MSYTELDLTRVEICARQLYMYQENSIWHNDIRAIHLEYGKVISIISQGKDVWQILTLGFYGFVVNPYIQVYGQKDPLNENMFKRIQEIGEKWNVIVVNCLS